MFIHLVCAGCFSLNDILNAICLLFAYYFRLNIFEYTVYTMRERERLIKIKIKIEFTKLRVFTFHA